MKRNPKHIALFLLLLFIVGQFCLVHLTSVIVKHHQREKMELFTSKQNKLYKFTKEQWSNAKWIDKHEIELDGNLFDLKSFSTNETHVYAIGHFDKKEQVLKSKNEQQKKHEQSQKKSAISFSYFIQQEANEYDFYKPVYTKQLFTSVHSRLVSRKEMCDSPPPKV